MDIIDQIEIPSFERKNASFRRNFAIAAGCVGLVYALEHYNGSVSRTWKSVRRGVTAAIAAWLEDRGGFSVFPLEGDEAHLSPSGLDLNGLCGPRFTHDGSATTAAGAAYLTQGHYPQNPQQQVTEALGGQDLHDEVMAGVAAAHLFASADTPSFFQSTKFFACLDVEEARELFRATRRVSLSPHEVLFRSGDPSDSGIYIVLHGTVGVFLEDSTHNTPPIHANTLRSGESVGDLDVVDGAVRTVSCMALESGCLLVNVPRELFMEFVHSHPRALMLYLQQGLARLWRVAHFVLADFLQLQLYRPKPPGSALAAETAAAATVAAAASGRHPPRTLSNLFGQEQGTQTDPLPPPPMSSSLVSVTPSTSPASPPKPQRVAGEAVGIVAEAQGVPLPLRIGETGRGKSVEADMVEVGLAVGLGGVSLAGTGGSGVQELTAVGMDAAEAGSLEADCSGGDGDKSSGRSGTGVTGVALDPQQTGGEEQPLPLPLGYPSAVAAVEATSDGQLIALMQPQPPPSLPSSMPYSPYSPPQCILTNTGMGVAPSGPSAPTFNELLASAAASSLARGSGGPTHGPLRPQPPAPAPSTMAAAAAAVALLANVPSPPPPPPLLPPPTTSGVTAADATRSSAGTASGFSSSTLCAAPAVSGGPTQEVGSGGMGFPSERSGSNMGSSSSTPTLTGGVAAFSGSTSQPGGEVVGTASLSSSAALSSSVPRMTPTGGGVRGGVPSQRYGNGGLFGVPGAKEAEDGPRPQGPVCRWLPARSSPTLRRSFVLGERACLAAGWDIIDVEELSFEGDMWGLLSDPRSGVGSQMPLAAGGLLQDVDWTSGCFYLLLDGHLLAERSATPPGAPDEGLGAAVGLGGPAPGGLRPGSATVLESALIAPGSLISCAAFLSSTASRCKVVALESARLMAFSWQTLEALVVDSPSLLIRLLVAASAALGPVVRRFISLGLNRVWLESGDVAYRQGDFAECLYVVISGRLRLLHEASHPVTHMRQLHLEEEVGRGEAVGAVWAITGGHHDTTALCVRDSEVVRMSRSAFRVISADSPLALSKLFSNIARRLVAAWDSRVRSDRGANSSSASDPAIGRRGLPGPSQLPSPARLGLNPLKSAGQLAASSGGVRGPRPAARRGEIVTIAILPAGVMPDDAAAATMASALAGSPTDVAAAAAALAAGEAASMGGNSSGSGRAQSYSGLLSGAVGGVGLSGSWRWPPGMSKQGAALATLTSIKRLSGSLKDALSPFGPVLLLDATVLSLQFPTASERLDVLFYRSKVTSWMAAQEEEYRFILLEADVAASPWSSVCVAQADCILLVAPEGSSPQLAQPESLLVFNADSPAFARSKPRRTGLSPGMSAATSSSHLAAVAAAAVANAPWGSTAAAAASLRSPSRLSNVSSSSCAKEAMGPSTAHPPSPPSRSSTASLSAGIPQTAPTPPPANAAAAAGVSGGSQHAHDLSGAVQYLYGSSSAAMLRRVELVLLHPDDGRPPNTTAEWLSRRPNLSRHHHIRLSRQTDIQRLARWMAGKTVGIVLSGGGSRGLAHLGVLTALEDAGVPLDAVGGTSQGAFMAALYAQGLGREALNLGVRHYAQQLGSIRHLLSDITLPVLSLFSGSAFDLAVKRVFERGAQRLEDLWLPFFCVTTNLTRGEASVHTEGTLWKLVRASMTIVGLLPPVWEDGCLLVDGGYMNNMPVDVMRSMMGVDSVIVVDVEGRDDMGWRSLTPYDGGLSGWRLLWDRVCPFPRWRFTAASGPGRSGPRYAALINKLTSMTHVANLKRVAVEHRIDLYLRPPGLGGFRLMDFHLMDRIVKDAYRYATSAITQWKLGHRVGPFGIEDMPPPPPAAAPLAATRTLEGGASTAAAPGCAGAGVAAAGTASSSGLSGGAAVTAGPGAGVISTPGGSGGCIPAVAIPSCMTQLQKKQQPAAAVLAAVTASVGGTMPTGGVPFAAPPPPPLPPPQQCGNAVPRRRTQPPVAAAMLLPPLPRPPAVSSCPPPLPATHPALFPSMPPPAIRVRPAAPPPSSPQLMPPTQQHRLPPDRVCNAHDDDTAAAAGGRGVSGGGAHTTGVVRFADKVFVSPVESSVTVTAPTQRTASCSSSGGASGDDEDDPQLLRHRRYRASSLPDETNDIGVDNSSCCGGNNESPDGAAAEGSPPSPAQTPSLRSVMSRMSRSATRRSLLDME